MQICATLDDKAKPGNYRLEVQTCKTPASRAEPSLVGASLSSASGQQKLPCHDCRAKDPLQVCSSCGDTIVDTFGKWAATLLHSCKRLLRTGSKDIFSFRSSRQR